MSITLPVIDLNAILPQLILVVIAALILIIGLIEQIKRFIPFISMILLAIAFILISGMWESGPRSFSDLSAMMVLDDFSIFATLIFIAGALLTIMISIAYAESHAINRSEYYALIIFALAGMSMMSASVDLFTFFLSLEILSISLYILIGFEQEDLRSNEGALKYFLLGAFASGFILYGIALIYGATGSTAYGDIIGVISANGLGDNSLLLLGGMGMILIGMGFKISMVPFHAWTPDVYQGAPTPISAYMSTGSKAAGFIVLLRLFSFVFDDLRAEWAPLIAFLAILTMAIGNLIALVQTDLKRLLAYSSIAHAGYMLLALVVSGQTANASILFYLMVYTAMNLAGFGVIAVLAAKGERSFTLEDMAGLGSRHPVIALVMAIAMFSLAGIPPTAGFIAKFYLFSAVIMGGYGELALMGILLSGVSLYYYLRVVVWMYMRESSQPVIESQAALSFTGVAALCLSALAIIIIGLFPSDLLLLAQQAVLILQ
jgi:NADH-quinone oxidoreductase subunit N